MIFITCTVCLLIVSSYSSNNIYTNILNDINNDRLVEDKLPKASAAPTVTITSPTGGEYFDTTAPEFIVEISDAVNPIDTMWYTIDGGTTNITFTTNGTIDQNNWTALSDGSVTLTFYANNSISEVGFASVSINKDTGVPTVAITSPTGGEYFDAIAPDYVVEISDSGSPIDKMWYTIDGGTTNITFTVNGTIDQNNWTALADGPVTIIFYTNDSVGNDNSAQVIVNKDVLDPTVSISSPTGGEYFDATAPGFTVEITDDNLDKMWYTIDDGATNITFTVNATIDQNNWTALADGPVTMIFYANDSANNVAFDSVVVNKDTGLPIVSITYPTGGEYYGATAPSFTVEITDDSLDTMWYTIDGDATNITFTINGTIDQNNWTAHADGPITIFFYANDTGGNTGFDSVVVNKDTGNPMVTITSPTGGEYFDATAPDYVVEISDTGSPIDTMWYTINGGANIEFIVNGTIDQNNWTALADVPVTIVFYANDSAGNLNSDTVIINKDATNPTVSITSPTGGNYFDATAPNYVVEISDTGSPIDTMWYTINGGTNIEFTVNGTIDQNNWTALADGPVTIMFYANDSAGNLNSDAVIINKDTGNPIVTITSPAGGEYFDTTAPDYVVEISDSGSPIDTMWYTIDGGANIEFTVNGTIDQNNWTALSDGPVTLMFYANDSAGNVNSDTMIINKDTSNPTVFITSPTEGEYFDATAPDYVVEIGDSGSPIDTMWYTLNGGANIEFTVNGTIDQNNWTALADGPVTLMFYANDSAGNINNTSSISLYKDVVIPSLSINSPEDNTYWNSIPDIQVTAFDTYFDSVWYVVGGTKIMLESGVSEPFNSSIWNSLPNESQFIINFYANDSAGNTNNTYSFTLYKDVLPPRLIVNLPLNNTFCDAPPLINITAFDMTTLNLLNYRVGITNIPLTNNTEQELDIDIWNNLAQGEFIIYLYAYDYLNNLNDTYVLRLYKDTLAPEIIINSPEDSTFFNSRPRINITTIDPNLDTLWYRVGTTSITLSSGIEELLNGSIWDGLAEGPFNIEIFANDTFGHFNNSYVLTLYKDITTPSLIIILPINGTNYNSRPSINVTVFDTYFNTLWYRVGNTNITLNNNTAELLNLTIWNSLPDEGAFLIYFYANDSVGNLNNTFVLTLYKDIKAPTIIIDSPQSNDIFGENSPSVSLNVTDANLEEVWYQLSNGTVTTINYTWAGSINQTVWDQVGNGTVTIKFYANDTFNHLGFAEVTVKKSIWNPIITIENPQENELFGIIAPNITIYKSGTDLDTTWYTIDNGVTNYTFFGLSVVINQTAWDNYGYGDVTITFYINDSLGKIGLDEITLKKDPNPPEVSITFNSPPSNNSYWDEEPNFRITVYEPNIDSIWYRVGSTNITFINDTDIILNDTIWNGLPQGKFIIEVFAVDLLGYLNDSITLTFYKDTLAPSLVINQPNDGSYYNTPPPINITVYDPNYAPLSLTYTVTGYPPSAVSLENSTEELLDQGIWDSLPEGAFFVEIVALDMFNHRNDSFVLTLYKDTIAPTVVVNLPIDYSYWNTHPIVNITAIDPNLDTLWYRVGTTNIILTNNTDQPLDNGIWNSLTEGSFSLEIFANDSYGNLNNLITLTLYKDLTPPNININSPDNNTVHGSEPNILLFATDISVDSIWYSVGGVIETLTNGVPEPLNPSIWSSLPDEGPFTINFFANDSAGNLNDSIILTLYKDTVAPLVTVNLPLNNTYWNSQPIINVGAYDPNYFSISYQVSQVQVELVVRPERFLVNNTDEPLFIMDWLNLTDGIFFVDIFAEDSLGNINDSIRLTLYKDTDEPVIDIIQPQTSDIYGEIAPSFEISVTEDYPNTNWYTLTGNSTVISFTGFNGTIDQTLWDFFGNGTVTIRFCSNDTAGNEGYKDITVRKNIFAPIITINSPGTNDLFGITAPNFIIYKSGSLLNSTWYTLDNGITNVTFAGLSGAINQTVWDNFGFGIITLRFYINDSFGKIGFDEVSIRKDIDMPEITVNSPTNNTAFASSPFINLTIDEPNLDKVWYIINNSLIDITDNVTLFIDFSIWNSLPQGEFNIELFANDTMGNINSFNTLYLSKDTIGPNITINRPTENQKVGRNAPLFELLISDANVVDSRWYTIGWGGTPKQFTDLNGTIDQNSWEQIWDNLTQGATITIYFYARDILGNENSTYIDLIVEKPIELPKFLQDPLGLLLPTLGLVVMIPLSIKLRKSSYYKSLNNKDRKKFRNVLITAVFFLSLLTLYFMF